MIRLGIVVALAPEARCLVNRRIKPGQRAEVGGEAWVHVCGIGARRAQRAAESLLEAGATALLSWGIAGGLDATLSPGNLILPETVIAPDGAVRRVDASWHARIWDCLQRHVTSTDGPLLESRQVVADAQRKATLFKQSGAVAVDMESAAIGAVAERAGVPFMVIRAVADPARRTIPDVVVDGIEASGRVRLRALAPMLLRQPALAADLFQLRRDMRSACRALAKVARLIGPSLQVNRQEPSTKNRD